jgi:glutathione synthase/RimK-type ligase-like ATP-grasp enzyme
MSLAILYERSETDELGIKLTAREMGINLVYIPFRKVSIRMDNGGYSIKSKGKDYSALVKGVSVVLNRAQSKNRRLFAAHMLEAFGKHVINPSQVEYLCFSKLRTLLSFWKNGIKIPRTVYVPCDSHEYQRAGREIHNERDISDLIQQELGNEEIVVKPDAGTHGKKVMLAKKREALLKVIRETKPSITNPIGVLAQEFVQKWFYDLRIVVVKENGRAPYCFEKALARAGFKDFRTNTYLGNMVFGVNLPPYIREMAIKCGEVIGENSKVWVLALDAMLNIGEDKMVDDEYIKSELEKLVPPFEAVKKVKMDRTKKKDFSTWNAKLERAFQEYINLEEYENIKKIIEESMERGKKSIMFHEVNSCPEFWEQTRMIAEINLAVPLLRCAQSVTGLEM